MTIRYSFSDTETSGMLEDGGHEQRYEQPFQLAIVGADASFREVEAHDLKARRRAHIIGAAGAHATTRIDPQTVDTTTTSLYDMARGMTRYIERNPATIWFYWNMDYDTPIKRMMLFMSLFDPLATTTSGNNRADGMRIAKAAYCFNPDTGIVFPEGYQGKPSLRLGNMCAANGEPLSGAHDAVNDTRALMRLCKVMAEKDPRTWDHMMNLTTKQGVDSFIQANPVFLWSRPDARDYSTSAFCKVAHKGEGLIASTSPNLRSAHNELILANLAVDPETWRHLDDRSLTLMMKGRNPDNPRESLRWHDRPFQILKRNGQPVIWPYEPDPVAGPPGASPAPAEGRRRVSNLRDVRLMDLSHEDLDRRRKLIQEDRELCERLSIIAERMWQRWDEEKQIWAERDTGPKLLEDRVYDGIGLNMPQDQKRRLRKLLGAFHDTAGAGQWNACESLTEEIGNLFPKPDDSLKQTDPSQYTQQQSWRDYTVTLKRIGILVLYEQERAHECEWAYLKNPASRFWAEKFVHQRLTEPSKDSNGKPLEKPKYRTLADAERLAHDDLARYEKELADKQRKGTLRPELAEEYDEKIRITENCLAYYRNMHEELAPPEPRQPPAEIPVPLLLPEQHSIPDDSRPPDYIPRPDAAAGNDDFDAPVIPTRRKRAAKPAKTLQPAEAFGQSARRSPSTAMAAQGKRKQPVAKTTKDTPKAKTKPTQPSKRGHGRTP